MRYEKELVNFLEMLSAERSVTNNTMLAYYNDIKKLLDHIHKTEFSLKNIDLDFLEKYIAMLSVNYEMKPKSVSRNISSIRQFFNFLVSEGIVNKNVAIDLVMPKKSIDLPKSLSQNEIKKLLEFSHNLNTMDGIRTTSMIEILYSTGIRISELITLKLQSLGKDYTQHGEVHYVMVNGKGNKERFSILNGDAVESLQQYLKIRDKFVKNKTKTDWLYPSVTKKGKTSHITRQRFGQVLKGIARDAGVDCKIVSPHKIRHSFATHMLQNGANLRVVQELLGHSDISSTQIYTKISNDQLMNTVMEKHPLK